MFITSRRIMRVMRAVMPRWMCTAFAVCLAIPGPFDETAMLLAGVILIIVRFRRARSAWRGGKSHRALDPYALAA